MTTGIFAFVFVLGLIVLVHEIGHLVSAKTFNVYCKEFAIGMGPKLFSWQGKETVYSLRLLPFGGFVAMAGEEGVSADIPFDRTIKGIAPFKRIVVMLSGILMNLILALFIIIGIYMVQGEVALPPAAIIQEVLPDTPAQAAGFMAGDQILQIDFEDGTFLIPDNFYDVVEALQYHTGTSVYTLLRRDGTVKLTVTPKFLEAENRYILGINIPQAETKKINAIEAIGYGFVEAKDILISMVFAIANLIRGIGLESLSGPIGIFQVTQEQASLGWANLIYLTGILSLNVAVFNLLPLPIMDGGRVVLILYEIIFKKPINQKVEQTLMLVSASLLILLMLFVTFNDLVRLF